MKFLSSVIVVSFLCGVQQFAPILCDGTYNDSMVSNPSANGGQDNDCGIACAISNLFDSLFGSSAYDYYYYGENQTGNGSDYFDDYYYYNSGPVVEEEIIIIPVTQSGSGLSYGDYNYTSYSGSSGEGNMSLSGWSGIGIPFPPFSLPATNTSSTSGSPSSSSSGSYSGSSSGTYPGSSWSGSSGSGSTWGSGSGPTWSGSSSSEAATSSTSAPSTSAPASNTTASAIVSPTATTTNATSAVPVPSSSTAINGLF